jgi:two-component system response regulator RegA
MAGLNGKRNVLIVDPDPAQCTSLGRALMQREYEVFVTHSSESALGIAARSALGHAVVELNLPDHTGLKLVEQLRAANGKLKVVVLASNPSIATAVAAIKCGATEYLPKPALPEQVIAAFEGNDDVPDVAGEAQSLSLEALIWEHIDRALVENGGNVSAAARALDMHRRTLQRKLRQRTRQRAQARPTSARPRESAALTLEVA